MQQVIRGFILNKKQANHELVYNFYDREHDRWYSILRIYIWYICSINNNAKEKKLRTYMLLKHKIKNIEKICEEK